MVHKARMAKMFVPLAAVVALATACPNGDATTGQLEEAMINAGLDDEEAECVAEGADGEFDQEQLNEIGGASDLDEVSSDLRQEVDNILADCLEVAGGPSGETNGETDSETGNGDNANGDEDSADNEEQ